MSEHDLLAPAEGEHAASWLRRCHGFRVESAGRLFGFVEDALYGADPARPAALLVRTGMFRRKIETVSVEDVEAIYPHARLIWVHLDES
jgi:hypothetical protein